MRFGGISTTFGVIVALIQIFQQGCCFYEETNPFSFGHPTATKNNDWFESTPNSCDPGYELVDKPEGPRCIKSHKNQWETSSSSYGGHGRHRSAWTTTQRSTRLPTLATWSFHRKRQDQGQYGNQDPFSFHREVPEADNNGPDQRWQWRHHERKAFTLPDVDQITHDDRRCLEMNRVHWKGDGRCYKLLEQGPCGFDEWLVLREKTLSKNEIEVVCERQPCPCNPKEPMLCEVWYDELEDGCSNKCKVSLAAEQDGLCGENEQLLVNPFGRGECGCRMHHMRWEGDGKCHALHVQGPCQANHTLQYIPQDETVRCVLTLCPHGQVLHSDGRCYSMETRGPCDEYSEFKMDSGDHDPSCKIKVQVKRVFDMAPSKARTAIERDSILGNLRFKLGDTAATTREEKRHHHKRISPQTGIFQTSTRTRREDRAVNYLNFLRKFRRNFNF